MNPTTEPEIDQTAAELLDTYLDFGAAECQRRFRISEYRVISIMREAGVPIRKRGDHRPITPPAPRAPRRPSPYTRLTALDKAALRTEFIPGKPGENARLAKKYNTSSAWVSMLTRELRQRHQTYGGVGE